jgi:hypothetical protein
VLRGEKVFSEMSDFGILHRKKFSASLGAFASFALCVVPHSAKKSKKATKYLKLHKTVSFFQPCGHALFDITRRRRGVLLPVRRGTRLQAALTGRFCRSGPLQQVSVKENQTKSD